MAELYAKYHPMLDQLHAIQDSLAYFDLAALLDEGEFCIGGLRGIFTPWEDAEDDYPVSRLRVQNTESGITTIVNFAPPYGVDNPMGAQLPDLDNPEILRETEVLARVLLNSVMPITEVVVQDARVPVDQIQVSLTSRASIVSYPGAPELGKAIGPYESTNYRSTANILGKHSSIEVLAAVA